MKHPDDGMTFDDEELVADNGVYAEVNQGRDVDCGDDKAECAPDDIVEDPINDDNIPGTVDDLPYDYGVETPVAVDQELFVQSRGGRGGIGRTGSDPEWTESELGAEDERDLWSKQRVLIDEDERESARDIGLDAAELEDAARAYGGDAAEPLPMNPDGVSSGGVAEMPEHGGFPSDEK
jgi:hypothetical protein